MGDFKCFYVEEELYDGSLAIQIMQGLREKIISDTPIAYFKLYTSKLTLKLSITTSL